MIKSTLEKIIGIGTIPCCAIWLISSCNKQPAPSVATLPARPPTTVKPFAPAFAAMTYYDQSCANCHGPSGSFYGPTLGNDLTDGGLINKCRAMAIGPGNAPITEQENFAVTAFHRSLILHTPFLSVTDITGTRWTGEATPLASVSLHMNNRAIPAVLSDWTWTADLPPNTTPADVTIEAELNGKTTKIKPGAISYSHTTPLPPPNQRRP